MPKTKVEYITGGHDRDLYSGLIRLHVLHHAAEEPIFGLGMVEELARHGYRISPGTLYPLRSEEHTSELQSLRHLVCRLLLEKKNKKQCTRVPRRRWGDASIVVSAKDGT